MVHSYTAKFPQGYRLRGFSTASMKMELEMQVQGGSFVALAKERSM